MLRLAITVLFGIASVLSQPFASAADAGFDREAEILEYLSVIQDGAPVAVINASNSIYHSGISDARLAKAISDRLLRSYPDLTAREVSRAAPMRLRVTMQNIPYMEVDYAASMVHALASQGLEEYAPTLRKVAESKSAGGSPIKRVRGAARVGAERIAFYKRRNEIMNNSEHYDPATSVRAAMLINLLRDQDPQYREYGMDRVYTERLRDPAIYDLLAAQIREYMSNHSISPAEKVDGLFVHAIKLLGFSGDRRHQTLLSAIIGQPFPKVVQKAAQASFDRLK